MRAHLPLPILFAALAVTFDAAAENAPSEDATKTVDCVVHKTEARFVGLAYDHLVHLENRCTYSVACEVKTDVNPTPETVKLSPKEKKTHLTFRGSPARIFKATVTCTAR